MEPEGVVDLRIANSVIGIHYPVMQLSRSLIIQLLIFVLYINSMMDGSEKAQGAFSDFRFLYRLD
jgi:hypothetical protein